MNATLTISLDSEILEMAAKGASVHHTTVEDLVTQQLRVIARNWQESRSGATPITDSLRGSVAWPLQEAEDSLLAEEIGKRHA